MSAVGSVVRRAGSFVARRASRDWWGAATAPAEPVKEYGHALRRDGVIWSRNLELYVQLISSRRAWPRPAHLVGVNFLDAEFVGFDGPKVFIRTEPAYELTAATRAILADGVVDAHHYDFGDPDPDRRMWYPGLGARFRRPPRWLAARVGERRPALVCMVNRYRGRRPGTLHGARLDVAAAFGDRIEVFGGESADPPGNWSPEQFRGPVDDKIATLRRYTFNVCFENYDEPGYVTEKIFDALIAGCVPLYRGGGGLIGDSVPRDCFVDCAERAAAEVVDLARSMSHDTVVEYRRRGLAFLSSQEASRFTNAHLRAEIARRLRTQQAGPTR